MSHLEINKLFSVEGMVAVITGGGSGLGLIMAQALAANGASKVYIIGRREHKLTEAASSSPKPGTIIPIVGDVGSKDSLQNAYDQISASTTHIDLLVANSGVMGPLGMPQKGEGASLAEIREHLWNIPMEQFTNTAHVNVTGAFYTAVAFLPLLEEANKRRPADAGPNVPRPQIIVTTSIAGFMRAMNPAMSYAYSSSKAAANHLVKQLSTALAGHQIRVNGISPGLYHSEMSIRRYEKDDIPNKGLNEGSFGVDQIPLTRSGSEEDIAGVILWLAGRTGSYVNGNIVISDGGRLAVHQATY
ncbi:hypothetical protein FQN54_005087 [Arachnomyces sp. PD_36]|nr:hypothetical protein FQN54_005087 [Arachnomyces sp. PD_36]